MMGFGEHPMAGPALVIITSDEMSEANRQRVEALLAALSDEVSSQADQYKNFRVAGRPFIAWFGSDYTDDEVDPDFPAENSAGFVPAGQVGIAAMCNQTVDHILLATIASRLATLLEGRIWFSGQWKPEYDPSNLEVGQPTSVGPHSYLIDAEFIYRWIEDRNFRLPK